MDTLCHDINECNSTEIIKPCNQICYNTIGSYKCDCTAGYTLLQDGFSCKASTSNNLKHANSNEIYNFYHYQYSIIIIIIYVIKS